MCASDQGVQSAGETEELVSIIGDRYLEPLSGLAERLFSFNLVQNEVQASVMENGYSVSLCILTAAWFESWTVRLRYLIGVETHANKKHPIDFLKAVYSDLSNYDELMEFFVLRDTLLHNHLWQIQIASDLNFDMNLQGAQKAQFSGNTRYPLYVDFSTRKTKKLQLNVVPIRVCNSDFRTVLKVAWDGLSFIKAKKPDEISVGNGGIRFQGKFMSMPQFVRRVGEISSQEAARPKCPDSELDG